MLKKAVNLIVIFLIIILIYQLVIIYLENSHDVSYNIISGNNKFIINEEYKKDKNEDAYFIKIKSNNREYVYYINNSFNKQKKIITDIKSYEKDDYLCIYPITINKKVDLEILCNNGNNLVSYTYADEKIGLKEFVNELSISNKYGINNTNEFDNDNNVYFYKNNFYDNEYLELYRYKYLNIYNKGNLNNFSFSSTDIYKNELGFYLKNYFIIPIINDNKTISKFYIYNIKSNKYEYLNLPTVFSTNLYSIGILDDKLYLFDLNNKIEFSINPKDNSCEIIGSVTEGFKMYENGEWVSKSITEFTNNKIKFNTSIKDEELKFSYNKIYETNNSYYLIDGNNLYKVYKKNKNIRILLFNIDNYNNLNIENDRIYFIKGAYLYRYDQYGIKTLVYNNEFNYNNTNIYHIYYD